MAVWTVLSAFVLLVVSLFFFVFVLKRGLSIVESDPHF